MATRPPITLKSPLPAADLFFQGLSATQGLSALDEIDLELLSEKGDIAPEKLLGKPLTVEIDVRDGGKRHFHGFVARFAIGRPTGRFYGYRVSVRPWLWFLTRTSDCRIFQDQTVPEIVEKVFADFAGLASFKFDLNLSYRKRVYTVQYRETDFNFVARLLEDEGIFWFFEHSDGAHKLVLVDDVNSLKPAKGAEKLPFYENAGQVPPGQDYIGHWTFSREVQTGKVALTSYDFEKPSASLAADAALVREHAEAEYEEFDFQGEYTLKADGQHLADTRIDELQSRHERLSGNTNAQALITGHTFELFRHPRDNQNAKYLCVQTQSSVSLAGHEAGTPGADYHCNFTAAPAAHPWRAPRRTPKPFVQGPQTAVVVGPGGDEIFTDKYGRVKVQFHWDRLGKKDDKSSCWVRVSSPWAGKSFGFMQVPRIGQEVVVDFLEGDPDQPIITGRVYNAEQMPPWELPANMTQSGVLTRSSKGGGYGNANALRFEDKKGSEQVWLHAEKNQDIEVENDETHWVGHDRTKTIDHDETTHVKHDRTETVDNNETITIHANRTEVVDKEESISIGGGRTESVAKNESISIGGSRTESVAKDESISIDGNRSETVAKNESVSVTKNRSMDIGDNETLSVGKNRDHTVGKNETLEVGENLKSTVGKNATFEIGEKRETKVGKDDLLQVGKKYYLEAGDEITLKTGDASITMKKDGTIQIKGKDITVSGSGKIGIKASGDLVVKGSKLAEN